MSAGTAYVNGGTAVINNRIIQAGTAPKYLVWGTGTTTPAVTDTVVQTPAAPTTSTAVTGTESRTTVTVTNDSYSVSGTITAGGSLAITEVGTIDSATISGANLVIHGVFAVVKVSSGDSIAFVVSLTQVANEA